MKIDQYDFENTAKAVFIMNPFAKDHYGDWQDLMYYMEIIARGMGDETTSLSTGGFQLTAFGNGKNRHVRASVSSYTALKFAEKVSAPEENGPDWNRMWSDTSLELM